MAKKISFIDEEHDCEWTEQSGKEWLFFGKPYHQWELRQRKKGSAFSTEFTTIPNDHYRHLEELQNTVPCQVGQLNIFDQDTKEVRPGYFIYWYQQRFYSMAVDFPEEQIRPMIEKYNADEVKKKSDKVRQRQQAMESEISKLRG